MTEHPGPEGVPPAEPAERDRQDGRRMAAGDANAPLTAPLPRNAGSWAAKVDRLTVADGGSRGSNVAAGASPARCRASGRCGERRIGSR